MMILAVYLVGAMGLFFIRYMVAVLLFSTFFL